MTAGENAGTEARGATVYRVLWVPGTDRLRGQCHCGAEREAEDPVEIWTWLLAHPDGHGGGGADATRTVTAPDGRKAGTPAVPIGV